MKKYTITKKIIDTIPNFFFDKTRPLIEYQYENHNNVVLLYSQPYQHEIIRFIKQIKSEVDMLLQTNEAYQIFVIAKQCNKIKGDYAEVGCYTGGSTKIICQVKGDTPIHVFDTFEGLPEVQEIDNLFKKNNFIASEKQVKDYLKYYKNVNIYKGLFPATATPIKDKKFSFVHLDVDIYSSTKDCLEFFYPRMNKGGVILSHDYVIAKGVRKAFDEFFKDKPEIIIELSGTQCMIIKL